MIKLFRKCITTLKIKLYSRNNKININTSFISIYELENKILKLSEGCYIGREVRLSGNISIGKYTSISDGPTEINAEKCKIKIGNFCSIGRNFFPRTSSHYINLLSTSAHLLHVLDSERDNFISLGDIEIGHDVWIGANVTVIGNVKIGNGAIIGAGSIVTKDIPPYSINVGNPARVVKYRFADTVIKEVERSEWWNLELHELQLIKNKFFESIDISEI